MRKLQTPEDKIIASLQDIQLQGLLEIDRVCRKHNIKYSISGGTALGAVRSNGFIPWDDDIDIDMEREEYEKLAKIIIDEIDKEKYEFQNNKVDKKYHHNSARLLIKNTNFQYPVYVRNNIKKPLCIDIFVSDYMPDNMFFRKIKMRILYFLRACVLLKWFGNVSYLPRDAKPFLKVILKITSYDFLHKLIDKISISKKKTGWIMDDCLVNGLYGGDPSWERDSYVDIEFEGHTIMLMGGYKEYLKNHYGKNYITPPPLEKRMTNHDYKIVDFGPYEKKYNLEGDYKKYLLNILNQERLIKVKELCLDMVSKVDEICKKENLKYYLVGADAFYEYLGLDEFKNVWFKNVSIVMPRKDYDKFAKVCENYFGQKYFYQSYLTDKEYLDNLSKIRLNNTLFHERRGYEKKFHKGIFIDIYPLDNAPNDPKKRKIYSMKLKLFAKANVLKWIYRGTKVTELKIKSLCLRPFLYIFPQRAVKNKFEKASRKYINEDTKYYIEPSRKYIKPIIKKDILGDGEYVNYLGHKVKMPSNLEKFFEITCHENQKAGLKLLSKLKQENNKKVYDYLIEINCKAKIQRVNEKKIVKFNLGMYDLPDYKHSSTIGNNDC